MPKLKVERVLSFSSEDSVHTASNLLSSETSKKWKCRSAGEKNASIVLQLEKASIISGIDIGNENSAYIEVLVSRSTGNDEFKVLLVMSSFMSPLEARQGTNVNKVRMFSTEQLQKSEREEKWDRVKIVCTQPYNRHAQYGLSFITLHSPEEKTATASVDLGKFTLRPSSPISFSTGSLFAKRKEIANESVKAAAAIREASSSAVNKAQSPTPKPKLFDTKNLTPAKKTGTPPATDVTPRPRNRDDLLYKNDEDTPNKKIDSIIEQKNTEAREKKAVEEENRRKETETKKKRAQEKKKHDTESPKNNKGNVTPGSSKVKGEDNKRKLSEAGKPNSDSKKAKVERLTRPFGELLGDVIFTISGIQNPDRADMRTMALELGAKYKPDWDGSCTHLVCAFPNTPKFNQVRGKGKIINKKWIPDCYNKRKKLPWRRYALDRNDQGKSESEDEICEKTEKTPEKTSAYPKKAIVTKPCPTYKDSDLEDELPHISDPDTEDEIERIQALTKKSPSVKTPSKKGKPKPTTPQRTTSNNSKTCDTIPAIFLQDTDEEDETTRSGQIDDDLLPTIFENDVFYVDQDIDTEERLMIERYIVALAGVLLKEPSDAVSVAVVTGESVLLRTLCPDAELILPDWIWECHNAQSRVPSNGYKL